MIAVFSFVGENAKIEIWFVPGTIEPTQMNGTVASSKTRLLHRRSICETQIATNDRRIPIVEIRVANCTPVVGEQNLHSTGLNIFAVRQANVVDVIFFCIVGWRWADTRSFIIAVFFRTHGRGFSRLH
jgi:hypothetical protein